MRQYRRRPAPLRGDGEIVIRVIEDHRNGGWLVNATEPIRQLLGNEDLLSIRNASRVECGQAETGRIDIRAPGAVRGAVNGEVQEPRLLVGGLWHSDHLLQHDSLVTVMRRSRLLNLHRTHAAADVDLRRI